MSEFKSGDEVLHNYGGKNVFEFVSGPDSSHMSCIKDSGGRLKVVQHNNIKPKPKTITVEMPKPKRAVKPVLVEFCSIVLEFDSEADADAAFEALKDVINVDPKGVE